MISNNMLPKTMVCAVHMRCPSSSGGKDWIGVITREPMYNGKFYVVYGKTSDVIDDGGQGRVINHPGTQTVLDDKIREKTAKGYAIIDRYRETNGCWDSELPSRQATQPTAPVPSPKPALPPLPASILVNPASFDDVEEWEW